MVCEFYLNKAVRKCYVNIGKERLILVQYPISRYPKSSSWRNVRISSWGGSFPSGKVRDKHSEQRQCDRKGMEERKGTAPLRSSQEAGVAGVEARVAGGGGRWGRKGRKGLDCGGHFVCVQELGTLLFMVQSHWRALAMSASWSDLSCRAQWRGWFVVE